jgi:hypothetical protein
MDHLTDSSAASDADHAGALKAFLRDRLTGQAMRKDWRRIVESAWSRLLETQIQQVVPEQAVLALIDAYLQPERFADLVRPGIRLVVPLVVAQMRADKRPLGRRIPDDAKAAIQRLASERGLLHEDWVRALFRQEAVEAVMNDALYRGIRDFSTIMPRIFLGLLPTSRLPGFGGAGAIGKRMLDELEKRIEPEIKSFLTGGTQRALARAAEFAVQHIEDPSSVSLRKNMIDFALSKSAAFHVQALTDKRLTSLEPIVESIAQHVAKDEESRRIARDIFQSLAKQFDQCNVRDVLEKIGVTSTPDFDAWAEATWPAIQIYLEAPDVSAWLDSLVDELLQEHDRLSQPAP